MLYHFTTLEKSKIIEIEGLKPNIGELTKNYHKEAVIPVVFFCDKKNIHTGWSSLIYHISKITEKKKIKIRRSNQKIKDINLANTENDIFKFGAIITTNKELNSAKNDNSIFGIEKGDYFSIDSIDRAELKIYTGIDMLKLIKEEGIEISETMRIPEYQSVYTLNRLEVYKEFEILNEINLFENFKRKLNKIKIKSP